MNTPAPPPLPKPPGAFRVIHTADWHLGKSMGDLDRTGEHRSFRARYKAPAL